MKKFTLPAFCLIASNFLFAQYYCGNSGTWTCSPVYSTYIPNFRNDSIPCIVDGQNTDIDIPIKTPIWSGCWLGCTRYYPTVVFLSVDSMPAGLCWSTSNPQDSFTYAQLGCIRLSGICTVAPGTYRLKFYVKYTTDYGNGLVTSYGYFGENTSYFGSYERQLLIRITDTNLPCFPVARIGNNNPYFVPYCSPGSVNIQQVKPLTCGQATAILSANSDFLNYVWSTGDTTKQISISTPGNYSLTVTDTLSRMCHFIDTVAVPVPTGSVTIQGPSAITCDQHTAILSTTDDYLNYSWSTGETTKQINVSTPGTYFVNVIDTLSAYCQFSDTFNVAYSNSIRGQEICGVTVDSVTGKNLIVWNKNTPKLSRTFFRVEKEIGIGLFTTLIDLPYDSLSSYLDATSTPAVTSYRYQLRVIDSCGNISQPSVIHETVHLAENTGLAGTVNLIWNKYSGTTYAQVNVLRQVNGGAWVNLSTLSGNILSFTDLNPPVGNLNYQIEVLIDSTCSPSRSAFSLLSNKVNINITVTGIQETNDDELSVYRLTTDSWQLTVGSNFIGSTTEVFDINGKLVLTTVIRQPSSVISPEVSSGVYLLRITSGTNNVVRKLVRW